MKLLRILPMLACLLSAPATAQSEDFDYTEKEDSVTYTLDSHQPGISAFQAVSTNSPRDTLASFIRLAWKLESGLRWYREDQTRQNARVVLSFFHQFLQLIDLRAVPHASEWKVGLDTLAYLLDILGRVDLPSIETVPDETDFADIEGAAKWRIPGTPLWISRIEEGVEQGEFLFSGRTVEVAPWFYERIAHLPLRSDLEIESWTVALAQLHGPLIPSAVITNLPDSLKEIYLDTPLWKIITVLGLGSFATLILILLHRLITRQETERRFVIQLRRLLTPVLIVIGIIILMALVREQINVRGQFASLFEFSAILIFYLGVTWAFWTLVMIVSEWIILSPKISEHSLDANLLRLSARVVGTVGSVLLLAYGAQDLGLPVFGLVAGLGVGGLAVALAIRPTLENLIGGAILYLDKPVRVGDYCTFGAFNGTVENIGVRSTQIRTLDRTLITVPNAQFVDMEIVNWAKADRMMIRTIIGLRYETSPDQLRYVLARIREMCYAHPKVETDTVRVRFTGYGDSALNVTIRVYVLTSEWNEYYAIQEDLFLRVNEIVEGSGTGFAFPSSTLYVGKDSGLDTNLTENAEQQVRTWRRTRKLPFPGPGNQRIEEIDDTLDYPPRGSLESGLAPEERVVAEPLSAAPAEEPAAEENPPAESGESGNPEEGSRR